ncbi:MAG TPA: permease [Candidatus Krumholzibacteria bacterium]|nr:permease [Candidatus Krumholzibacteria bacterium]HPD70619.1 permease [Candidatus Krumholzibacteria bacterium]HRY39681.1 permease [Candidatus Krumholzibacteria bacterium]
MGWRKEWKPALWIIAGFLIVYYLPVGQQRFDGAVTESLALVKWYAREHVLLCLVPAFFIAGAISVFVSSASVMRHLGASAPKVAAYGVASVSGTVLAVCSCTVLPLFAGIYRMGAGLGPASAFLYSGPAINVLAIILTARVLGMDIGVGRAVGAVAFSIVIGLLMHVIYRKEEAAKAAAQAALPEAPDGRSLGRTAAYFATMIAVLVFANWGQPAQPVGFWNAVYSVKWPITSLAAMLLGGLLVAWFGLTWWKILLAAAVTAVVAILPGAGHLAAFAAGSLALAAVLATEKGELNEWLGASWGFAKQILPLLLVGVLVAGLLLGRPDHEGLIPSSVVAKAVGGNSPGANLFASVAGALMYFATLTEVPILQGLLGSGMGKGPALALLLAGPALSLPSILVLRSIFGWRKTLTFVSLVVVMATITGLIFGSLAG